MYVMYVMYCIYTCTVYNVVGWILVRKQATCTLKGKSLRMSVHVHVHVHDG